LWNQQIFKMVFEAEKFLKAPTLEVFNTLKKTELVLLAQHLKLKVKSNMRKQEIKNILIKTLVNENIFEEEALNYIEQISSESEIYKLKELECQHQLKMKDTAM